MRIKVHLSAILVIASAFYFGVCDSNISNEFPKLYRSRRQSYFCRRQTDFRCDDGQCISSYDKCDGVRHCIDGSDETSAACKTPGVECPLLSFQCSYGACVAERLRCDGKDDCADGSDERGCSESNQNVYYNPSASTCSNYEFRCTNGQCISEYDICDGVKHCMDGSDETRNLCLYYECPPRSFKCTYGACLKPSLRCNGKVDCSDGSDELGNCPSYPSVPTTTTQRPLPRPPSPQVPATVRPPAPLSVNPPAPSSVKGPNTCVLPNHPKHGAYDAFTKCSASDPRPECYNTPGAVVSSSWVLKYTCDPGYSTDKDSAFSICENGVWENPIDCIKLCPPLRSLSVDVECFFGGATVNCSLPMNPDTQARAQCKPHYKLASLAEYSLLLCLRSGEWSYRLFTCSPECGLSLNSEEINNKKGSVPLISGPAVPIKVGEFPWLTAIYRKVEQKWDQQCGGTLITPHIIITAAHCLVNNNYENKPVHPSDIRIGLGKYLRDYYIKEQSSIISEVKEVVIPDRYVGESSQFAQDVGLIDLVVSVQITTTIMPACIDWSSQFEPGPQEIGVVAGWGRVGAGLESSEVALSARLTFIKYLDCLKYLSANNKKLVTPDKFCAGDVDGSAPERGDSGGGLTFVKDGKHFLIGIVSTKIPGFRLFLDLSNKLHRPWLESERERLRQSHVEF
ncbi:modular serine protease-like [Macrosteles quadrilineatus]|uniref:modular serine protease-like n=1 Tax=Macrosteles quadrilineatus TaxID=74068 RepID=UPI0023E22AE6|nr:modular serine protease-like [Macrosteles quadrilineatus]